MIIPVWYVAISGLCLFIGGENSNGNFLPSNSEVFSFTCKNPCEGEVEVLDCELKLHGKCAKRYYLTCLGKQPCQWGMVKGSCDDEEMKLGQFYSLTGDKNIQGGSAVPERLKKRSETGISYLKSLGIIPALRNKFSSIRRRDLSDQQQLPLASSMVMTSGNGHAYVMDGTRRIESHFGSPAMISSLPRSNVFEFPFSFVSQYSSGLQSTSSPPEQQGQFLNNWNGYNSVSYPSYNTIGSYSPMYQRTKYYPYSDGSYATSEFSLWRNREKSFSPFTSFFNSVGLQDPMLMLQYFPIG